MVDLSKEPVFYTPQPGQQPQTAALGRSMWKMSVLNCKQFPGLQQPAIANGGASPSTGVLSNSVGSVSILKSSNNFSSTSTSSGEVKGRKTVPPTDTRMVVYVRQENEEIYTPLHLVPPTVPGLARAIESKYNVSATAIR